MPLRLRSSKRGSSSSARPSAEAWLSWSRPAILPMPAFVLRAGLGELSELLLGGQRAVPTRLLEAGFSFRFTHLDVALADLLGHP